MALNNQLTIYERFNSVDFARSPEHDWSDAVHSRTHTHRTFYFGPNKKLLGAEMRRSTDKHSRQQRGRPGESGRLEAKVTNKRHTSGWEIECGAGKSRLFRRRRVAEIGALTMGFCVELVPFYPIQTRLIKFLIKVNTR